MNAKIQAVQCFLLGVIIGLAAVIVFNTGLILGQLKSQKKAIAILVKNAELPAQK